MARSTGYRATKENKEEVAMLRKELSKLRYEDWQQAGLIMQEIARLTGKINGPSGGFVRPRACKYCKYFGHTKNFCLVRQRDEAFATEREVGEHKRDLAMHLRTHAVIRELP